MRSYEYQLKTSDGLALFGRGWEPESPPKAVICLVHGLGEHSGRYDHFAAFFTANGYAVHTFDLRGHGRSEGARGYAPEYSILLRDVQLVLQDAARRYPDKALFLYGHSFGGTLVIEYALEVAGVRGVISSAPLFTTAFEPPAWKVSLGKLMRSLWPTFSMSNEIHRPHLSRDARVVEAYENDPLVHDQLTAKLGIDMLEIGASHLDRTAKLGVPLLLMVGEQDHLVSVDACRTFAERAGDICTLKIWEGLYHEMHNEPEQADVMTYGLGWLNQRV